GVVDDAARVRVAEQVAQLLFDVSVVDVERRDARLVGADHRFEVFVAVIEVEGDVILPRLPRLQLGALAMATEAGGPGAVGGAPRTQLKIAPGQPQTRGNDRLLVGNRVGDRLVDRAQGEGHAVLISHQVVPTISATRPRPRPPTRPWRAAAGCE